MKVISISLLILCGSLLWYFLSATKQDTVQAKAKVVGTDGGLLVYGEDENFSGLTSVGMGEALLPETLSVGDTIQFSFDGMVAESYPCKINNVEELTVITEGNDIMKVYREAFLNLRAEDSDLDYGAERITLDISGVTNLSEGEKEALHYLISCDVGRFGESGFGVEEATFEELVAEGSISVDENGFHEFEDGIHYEISATAQEDGFLFDIHKMRSSQGVYGFYDCKATFTENGVVWEEGSSFSS